VVDLLGLAAGDDLLELEDVELDLFGAELSFLACALLSAIHASATATASPNGIPRIMPPPERTLTPERLTDGPRNPLVRWYYL
jgi:hypothetical protein